ncbi:hypothetical protein [Methylophilus sp. OH31]|uniref:hypothetical protein n=1 Tax=Methylophilus sp. OH31 TaxID=1387312 RepID=UPI000463E2BE|nr:hypothetical protein [Methylophilus sp. OH31]
MPKKSQPAIPYDREHELQARLNQFFVKEFNLSEKDYAVNLSLLALLNLKTVLSDINNTITLKLSLGLADWVSQKFELNESATNELRKSILKTKPNSNGFDVWLGYPITFVAEVKCNIPVNGGNKYGAQQKQGIISDIDALINGKRKASMLTQDVLKFMAFLDLPSIREANKHLLKTNPTLNEKLVFLEPNQNPIDLNYVYGVYVNI